MIRLSYLQKNQRRFITTKRELLRYVSMDFFGPEMVRIYPIGYLCNHSCPMCWRSNNVSNDRKRELIELEKQSLTLIEYEKILSTLPPGVSSVEIVGGGEPLLYKNFTELTDMIKKRFYYGSLITNGVLLKPNLNNHLLSIAWDRIRVSVHASNEKIYQTINGVSSFEIVWRNIKQFLQLRKEIQGDKQLSTIGVLSVIQKGNYNDVYSFAQLAQEIGCDYIEFDTVYPYTPFMKLDKTHIAETTAQLEKVIKKIQIKHNAPDVIRLYKTQPHAGENGADATTYYKSRMCTIPTQSMIIDSFGHTHPCCFLDNSEPENIDCGGFRQVGNVWSIWKRPSYKQIRKNLRSGKFFKTCIRSCNYALPKRS